MTGRNMKIAASVTLLALAALLTVRALRHDQIKGNVSKSEWFYDLQSGTLFTAAADRIAPIGTPDAPDSVAGVRAYVYTCGSCDEKQRKVLYIEKYTDAARDTLTQINALQNEQQKVSLWPKVSQGQYVAEPPDAGQAPQWVLRTSPRGKELTKAFWTMCGPQGRGSVCHPQ